MHTTNQDLYTTLTGSKTRIDTLIDGIFDIQQKYPHLHVKINSAIIKEQNMPDSEDFAYKMRLASLYGWKLKYLELSNAEIPGFVDLETFENELIHLGFVPNHKNARQRSYIKDGVEVITGRIFCSEAKKTKDPQRYCKHYNDIYIAPDGYLSSCPVDIKKLSAYDA